MISVRPYKDSDRSAVRRIHFDTWLVGRSLRMVGASRERVDAFINPYITRWKEHAFVAVDGKRVVGYVVGAFPGEEQGNNDHVRIVLRNVLSWPVLSKGDRRFWGWQLRIMLYLMTHPGTDVLAVKPPRDAAHLHVNLAKDARGKGIGKKLLETFFSHLRKNSIKKVFAQSWGTRINDTSGFWRKMGFRLAAHAKTRFWKEYFPEESVELTMWVKKP